MLGTYLFGLIYWNAVPETMKANSSVALLTQQFMNWHDQFKVVLGWTLITFLLIAAGGITGMYRVPRLALLIPTFMGIWLLGHFERAREFMRKPWVIGEYMYSNGVHKDELAFLQSEGLLKHATYVSHREVTDANRTEVGRDIFMLACTRCHSTTGLNGVVEKFEIMYGPDKAWDPGAMESFILSMHQARPYMPPFPGNQAEAAALVDYLLELKETRTSLPGAQSAGVVVAPLPAPVPATAISKN